MVLYLALLFSYSPALSLGPIVDIVLDLRNKYSPPVISPETLATTEAIMARFRALKACLRSFLNDWMKKKGIMND